MAAAPRGNVRLMATRAAVRINRWVNDSHQRGSCHRSTKLLTPTNSFTLAPFHWNRLWYSADSAG